MLVVVGNTDVDVVKIDVVVVELMELVVLVESDVVVVGIVEVVGKG